MIKIERKPTEKALLAQEDLKLAREKGTTYNTDHVNEALREMFHGKCYICENKEATSFQIEHLIPYKGDVELKYDWNNLLWACAHCNNIKLDKYRIIRKHLRENISDFKNYVREYIEAVGEDKEDLELLIQNELSDKSEFTAFKRWLVRDSENLPELKKYL